MNSPDVDEILRALERIYGNEPCIVPEDLYDKVSHGLSTLGADTIRDCAGKNLDFKIGYLIAASRYHKES